MGIITFSAFFFRSLVSKDAGAVGGFTTSSSIAVAHAEGCLYPMPTADKPRGERMCILKSAPANMWRGARNSSSSRQASWGANVRRRTSQDSHTLIHTYSQTSNFPLAPLLSRIKSCLPKTPTPPLILLPPVPFLERWSSTTRHQPPSAPPPPPPPSPPNSHMSHMFTYRIYTFVYLNCNHVSAGNTPREGV